MDDGGNILWRKWGHVKEKEEMDWEKESGWNRVVLRSLKLGFRSPRASYISCLF